MTLCPNSKSILVDVDQTFTCKLGGRKPTHSGKPPTSQGISPKIDNFQYFLMTKPGNRWQNLQHKMR